MRFGNYHSVDLRILGVQGTFNSDQLRGGGGRSVEMAKLDGGPGSSAEGGWEEGISPGFFGAGGEGGPLCE